MRKPRKTAFSFDLLEIQNSMGVFFIDGYFAKVE